MPDKDLIRLKADLEDLRAQRQMLAGDSVINKQAVEAQTEALTNLPDTKKILGDYYEGTKLIPLTSEQKRSLLKPEVLAAFSQEEYIALWRRLNPYFLSHVTRQGFRDHTGNDAMVSHDSTFHEYNDGFLDVMRSSRRIYPPLARVGLSDRSPETVEKFVIETLKDVTDPDEAKTQFKKFLTAHMATAPRYPDITATHFAAQIVSDKYYGGESGNEVFFLYPADVLASQYPFAFNGWEKDFTKPQSETKWNDVFFWTNPNSPGIPVDSGIVFLPKSTMVDPETGSKYSSVIVHTEAGERREMIENTNLISDMKEWLAKLNDESEIMKAYADCEGETDYFARQTKIQNFSILFSEELERHGIGKSEAGQIVDDLIYELRLNGKISEDKLLEAMNFSGAYWLKAHDAVPAKQYWTQFFVKHPDIRPKHIVFYDGDPTGAVGRFIKDNNIGTSGTSPDEGVLLGFEDNHVEDMESDARANVGFKDLIETANKHIEYSWSKK